MLRSALLVPFALVTLGPAALHGQEEPASLVLRNGRIVTLDEGRPEVRALAARGDEIVAIGSEAEVATWIGAGTQVIDLEGRLAIPGFIEGHAHFLGIGDSKMQLPLADARRWSDIVAMVELAADAARDDELIRGRGWHQEKWEVAPEGAVHGLPVHESLSAVSPRNPVVLVHASGHASFANARAMELAGIDAGTPDPPGGEIVRDASGEPIGVFRETAQSLLFRAMTRGAAPDGRRVAQLAAEECLAKGVTSFQDAGSSFDDVELLREMAESGELGVRLWMMLRVSNEELERRLPGYRVHGVGDEHLTVGGLKVSIDGALGPHGAWLLEPYEDLPESAGLNTVSVESVERLAELALEHGLQLCVHAIGDRANREVLDLMERAFADVDDGAALRWRIEHAQHLHPDDIPRFARLGVIAAMQGVHCTSDAPWIPQRLGDERARTGAYVWRDLLESGAIVTNGTDAPVEDVDPIASFHASVSRRLPNGEVFYPRQRMTRLEALRSYTLDAAYSAFEEDRKGSLSVGKLADITVLSLDILDVPEDRILDARVVHTIVGGEVRYTTER